jgi:hypothetical protein
MSPSLQKGSAVKSLFIFAGISAGRDPLETLAGISAESFLFRMMLRWKILPPGTLSLAREAVFLLSDTPCRGSERLSPRKFQNRSRRRKTLWILGPSGKRTCRN